MSGEAWADAMNKASSDQDCLRRACWYEKRVSTTRDILIIHTVLVTGHSIQIINSPYLLGTYESVRPCRSNE